MPESRGRQKQRRRPYVPAPPNGADPRAPRRPNHRRVIFHSVLHRCGKASAGGQVPGGGTPNHLHELAAVPGDLELPQSGHAELRAAFPAHQEDLQLLDVLDLWVLPGPRTGGGPERDHANPGDGQPHQDRREHDPPTHGMRSRTTAFAIPPPSHMTWSPYRPLRRSSSATRSAMSRAPLAPTG